MKSVEIVRNEEYERRAIEVISSAQSSIYFSTFKIHITKKKEKAGANQIFSALLERIKAGIKVGVLLQCGYDGTSLSKLNRIAACRLVQAGARVRYLEGKRIVHAKIILADNVTALIGSHNWSAGSLRRNFEVSVLVRDSEVGELIQSFFEKEWDRAREFRP